LARGLPHSSSAGPRRVRAHGARSGRDLRGARTGRDASPRLGV